jgi:hypothetical protein
MLLLSSEILYLEKKSNDTKRQTFPFIICYKLFCIGGIYIVSTEKQK